MPASSPVTAAPPAQTAAPPAGGASARASGRSAAPAFTDRLEAALGQPTGAPQDAGLAMPAPAAAIIGQSTESTETTTNATPAAPSVLTVLSGAPATPPTDSAPSNAAAQANGSGPEPTEAPIRAPGKPATGPARGGRSDAAGPDSRKDATAPDPATPTGVAPFESTAPQPAPAAVFAPPDAAHGTAHPATDSGTPPTAAPRNEGPSQTDQEPTRTTPRNQAPATPTTEARLAGPEAMPTSSPTETATDPTRAATGIAHEAPSAEALIRAAEASQPTASPVGRATPVSQPTVEPSRAETASPAQQIAAPLVALGSGPEQSRRMTVRLDPAALGAVQVRIERPKDGPARVEVTVERPETLSLLLRDQPRLQQALDQAGIPPEGRSLVFQIATPDPQARNDTGLLDHRQGGGGQPLPGDGGARSDGNGGEGNGGGTGRGRRDGADEDGPAYRFTPSAALRRLRDGLDITA